MHWPFACFSAALLFFHCSEAVLAYAFNPQDAGWHSWLFSWPYAVAMAAACTEYALEWRLAPLVKGAPALEPVQWLGLVLVVFGEALRKASILTARRNFTHVVQLTRRPGHTLVTHGVYAFVRHPGYLGWFIWALLLLNPVCTLGFASASWLYFRRRIRFEEARLLQFFGAEYRDYMAHTRTYIPGV